VDHNSTYWRKKDGEIVYRTPGNYTHNIPERLFDWKDRKLYHFGADEVQKMEVFWLDSNNNRTDFTLKAKGDGNWEMLAPKTGNAQKGPAETMAKRFKELSIDEFPEEGDAPKMSESPTLEVRVTLNSGQVHQLVAQKGDIRFYVKHPSRDEIVKLTNWRLEVFEKTVDELYEEPAPEDTVAAGIPGDNP
jgi:hypothetical protein